MIEEIRKALVRELKKNPLDYISGYNAGSDIVGGIIRALHDVANDLPRDAVRGIKDGLKDNAEIFHKNTKNIG